MATVPAVYNPSYRLMAATFGLLVSVYIHGYGGGRELIEECSPLANGDI